MSTVTDGAKVALGILAVAVVCALAYLGYFWLFRDSTSRVGEIKRQTFEYQQGRVDAAQEKLAEVARIDVQLTAPDVDTEALGNQRKAIVSQTCKAIAQINGDLPSDLAAFKSKECALP
jgi:hypothetical protein